MSAEPQAARCAVCGSFLCEEGAVVSPYFLLLGLALTFLPRHDPRSVLAVRFRWPGLLLGGFAAQALLAVAASSGWGRNPVLLELAFVPILLGLWANLKVTGVGAVLAGALANAVALLLYGGLMPVSPAAMRMAGLSANAGAFLASSRHQFMHPSLFWWLGDWIPLFHFVLSPGDLLVGAGLIWFLYASSAKRGSHE